MNPPSPSQKVLFDIARRTGLVPVGDEANLDPEKAYEFLGYMDDRLREAWDLYDFIETTYLEQRAFRPDYDIGTCYSLGDIVWDPSTQQYYQALVQTIGAPLNNASIWSINPNVSPRYIEWWTSGKTPIGVCFGAWTKNPYEDPNAVRIDYKISGRGLEFTAFSNVAFVWLLFRIPYPGIGRDLWSKTMTYAQGDAVIDGMDTYISAIDGNVAMQPSLSPTAWSLFRVPYPMTRFVTQAAFADSLVTEGQNEKAPAELQKAYGYLFAAFDQQRLQQGQQDKWTGYAF
jgi:hypothetical protein